MRQRSTTRAERDGDEWVLTGSKVFITLGSWAATAIVFARTGGEGRRGSAPSSSRPSSAGFEARPMKGKLGLRAQDTAELSLDGVRVPDSDACSATEGDGFKVAMSALDNGRISLAAGCVGIAQGCLDASVGYAKEREAFRSRSPRFQLVQQLLAEMHVETEAARLLDVAAPRRSPTRGEAVTRSRRPSRSGTRARPPCAPRTPRCRCSAATATSTNTLWRNTFATRA